MKMLTNKEQLEFNEQLWYENKKHHFRKMFNEAPVNKIISEYNAILGQFDNDEPMIYSKNKLFDMLYDIYIDEGQDDLLKVIIKTAQVKCDEMFDDEVVACWYNGEEIEWFTESELRDYLLQAHIVDKMIESVSKMRFPYESL